MLVRFYTGGTRFYVGCEIFQQEKSAHRLPVGLLEPFALHEQKWADVSMDLIVGLPRFDEGNDGILTIVDRPMKMVHLVPVQRRFQQLKQPDLLEKYWGIIWDFSLCT